MDLIGLAVFHARQRKPGHIVDQIGLPDGNVLFSVGKGLHRSLAADAVGAGLDFPSNVETLPFIPIRDVREAGLTFGSMQLAVLVHGPAAAAGLALQGNAGGAHAVLGTAFTALIQDLVQSLAAPWVGDPFPVFLLPGKIVILEHLGDPGGDLLVGQGGHLLGGQKTGHRGFGALELMVGGVPEGRVNMVTMADQRYHRDLQEFGQLPDGGRQHRGGAAEGIAGFRIDGGDIAVLDHGAQLTDELGIMGKLALADTADEPKQPFASDKPVDGHHEIDAVGPGGLDRHGHVHEGVVVAQQEIGGLDIFHANLRQLIAVGEQGRQNGQAHDRPQVHPHRRFFHIVARDVFQHGSGSPSNILKITLTL